MSRVEKSVLQHKEKLSLPWNLSHSYISEINYLGSLNYWFFPWNVTGSFIQEREKK